MFNNFFQEAALNRIYAVTHTFIINLMFVVLYASLNFFALQTALSVIDLLIN